MTKEDSITAGHLEKYPFRAACKSDSKNLFEFDHRERVRWGARPGGTSGQLATCGLRSSAAAAHGSPDGDRGTARVHPSAAADGEFSPAPGGTGRERSAAA